MNSKTTINYKLLTINYKLKISVESRVNSLEQLRVESC